MRDFLVLRFAAPLMAFGGVLVDQRGFVVEHPGRSLLAGLLANALGYDHGEADRLRALQDRLRYASRVDRPGQRLVDFHTVDFSPETSPWMQMGWTTRSAPEGRSGGSAKEGTHIRERHYHADRIQTLTLTLDGETSPGLDDLEAALRQPARPLFLGRKTCLPAEPLLRGRIAADSAVAALGRWPRDRRADPGPLNALWPKDETGPAPNRLEPVHDERDWQNQIHAGRRLVRLGLVDPPAPEVPRA